MSQSAIRTSALPGSGRPIAPGLAAVTLIRIASPWVEAYISSTCAGAKRSETRSQSPPGMPEPTNSRTGWWRSPPCAGALASSRSIVHV